MLAAAATVAAVVYALRPREHAPPERAVPVVVDPAPVSDAAARRADALSAVQAAGSGDVAALLAHDPLDLELPEATQAGVTLHDVVVRRRGPDAVAEATVDVARLAALAPAEISDLRYDAEASADGGGVVLRGTAKALGLALPVTVRVVAVDGAVVAVPEGVPVGRQVLFDDPRVHVRRVTARPVAGGLRGKVEATIAGG